MKSNPVVVLILVSILAMLTACSVSFEKRRYNPGYHVETIHSSHRRQQLHSTKNDHLKTKHLPELYVQVAVENNSDTIQPFIEKDILPAVKTNVKADRKKEKPASISPFDFILKHIVKHEQMKPGLKATKEGNIMKILAWVFGGLAMAAIVVMIVLLIALSGWAKLGALFICLIVAFVLAIVAMVLALAAIPSGKTNSEITQSESEVEKPDRGKNASLILGIFSIVLAIAALTLTLVGLWIIGLIIACIVIALSIAAFTVGFVRLKKDKSIKNILGIIFGLVAFVMAVLAIILPFVFVL